MHFLLHRHAIEGWKANKRLVLDDGSWICVDILFPKLRLVVEVDGEAHHVGSGAFRRDRERDAALMAAGYQVLRFSWDSIVNHPERTIARLLAVLSRLAGQSE